MSGLALRPKLVVQDASAATDWYAEVLGATVLHRWTMGAAVVLAELELPGGDVLQVKDADEHDPAPGGPEGVAGVVLDVVCDDPDAVAARALERGARTVFEVADQPYGSRQGRFRDPFGHQWIVGTPVSLSDEEVQAALDAWAAGG